MPQYTRGDLKDRIRRLVAQTDPNNSNLSDSDLNDFIDDWLIDMAAWLEYPRAEATYDGGSVLDAASYAIDKKLVLKLLRVNYDQNPLVLTTEDFLSRVRPKWRSDSNGTPEYALLIDNDVLLLHPKPNASGKEILIRYVRIPTLPTADTDSFDLPVPLQITGKFYGASMFFASIGKNEEAALMLKIYESTRHTLRSASTIQLAKGGWEMQEELS